MVNRKSCDDKKTVVKELASVQTEVREMKDKLEKLQKHLRELNSIVSDTLSKDNVVGDLVPIFGTIYNERFDRQIENAKVMASAYYSTYHEAWVAMISVVGDDLKSMVDSEVGIIFHENMEDALAEANEMLPLFVKYFKSERYEDETIFVGCRTIISDLEYPEWAEPEEDVEEKAVVESSATAYFA